MAFRFPHANVIRYFKTAKLFAFFLNEKALSFAFPKERIVAVWRVESGIIPDVFADGIIAAAPYDFIVETLVGIG